MFASKMIFSAKDRILTNHMVVRRQCVKNFVPTDLILYKKLSYR